MKITRTQEDYLKLVWHLCQSLKKATVTIVATGLDVKSPTVLAMFRQLKKNGFITYDKSKGALLTPSGEQLARKLVRKHRLIETFLETVLDMNEHHVHEEAEKLEHVISDQMMYRVDAYLGFPERDPHGSKIPSWEKNLNRVKLATCRLEDSFTINELNFNEVEETYYINSNLVVGSHWTVVEEPPGGVCMMIGDGQKYLALSIELAKKIEVTLRS